MIIAKLLIIHRLLFPQKELQMSDFHDFITSKTHFVVMGMVLKTWVSPH